jgi:ComF family protein
MALINDFLSLIYPRHCEACANNLFKHEVFLCNYCKLNLPKSHYHRLYENELSKTFDGRVPLLNSGSYYLYEKSGKIQKLLQAIKYQDQKELAEYLGILYGQELSQSEKFLEVDVILPVPLHKNKLRSRSYNQSEWFAKGLSSAMQKELITHALERVQDTATQTRKKKYQRWENVEGIFSVRDIPSLTNKHVLLVDDVITTGATIEACWLALKDIEGIKVSIVSLAFAPKSN